MHGVSIRTLALLLVLLMAVISFEYLAAARRTEPDAVWLAGDVDPIAQMPHPEAGLTADS